MQTQTSNENDLIYYNENPTKINASLDFDLLVSLAEIDAENFKYITNQTEELIYAAYNVNNSIFKYIDFSKVTIQFLELVIGKNPHLIQYVYYPSIDLIMLALKADLNVFQFIEKFSNDSVFIYVLERNGLFLEFIPPHKQTEDLVTIAIQENSEAYKYAYVKTKHTDLILIKKDKTKINEVSEYWVEIIKEVIEYNPRLISQYLNKPQILDVEILKFALDRDPTIFKLLQNPTFEITLYAAILMPDLLDSIPYNKRLLKEAIVKNGLILKYMKNPDMHIIKQAITQNIDALQYTHINYDFFLNYAFEINPISIKYFKAQSKELCINAVKRNPFAIEFVKLEYVDKEMQLLALSGGIKIIPLIKNPIDDEVLLKMIDVDPYYIFEIPNPTKEMFKLAFGKDGNLILLFENWNSIFSSSIIASALSNKGELLEFVVNKTKPLIIIALNNYPLSIQWVEEQDLELALLASKDFRSFYYIQKNVFDFNLMSAVLKIDPNFFTRTTEITFEQWLEIVNQTTTKELK